MRIITQYSDILQELQRLQERHRPPALSLIDTALEQLLAFQRSSRQNTASQTTVDRPLRVSGSILDAAYQRISQGQLRVIRRACQQLEQLYRQQIPTAQVTFGEEDLVRGQRYYPVKRAGFYLENAQEEVLRGSRQGCLSNLLRQGMLAKVAGVRERVLVTPGDAPGTINPEILVAAQEMGIEEIYQLDGVTAIAALALGTDSLAAVASITGVGSAAVMAAKQLVGAWVSIDQMLERTDLIILVADHANPQLVALDLLAYADQDPQASLVVLTDRQPLADQISHWVATYCRDQNYSIHTEKAIAHYGLIGVVDDLTVCLDWVNQFEPYTLMVAMADPWPVVEKVQRAREIYISQKTPPLLADYVAGSLCLRYRDGDFRSASQLALNCFLQPCRLLDYGANTLPDWLPELVNSEDSRAVQQRLAWKSEGQNPASSL
ncbi:MAG: Histidinol dehydrogenase [Cyanobacteriota bacterium]